MTRGDLQIRERNKQRPWDLGKDLEVGTVFAPLIAAEDWAPKDDIRVHLRVNDETRQEATLCKVDEIISHSSGYYHLRPGDMILTGTPAGVGPVQVGDVIEGGIDGLQPIQLTVSKSELSLFRVF